MCVCVCLVLARVSAYRSDIFNAERWKPYNSTKHQNSFLVHSCYMSYISFLLSLRIISLKIGKQLTCQADDYCL